MSFQRRGKSELMLAARKFWYDNEPETFHLDFDIPRSSFQMYGGPSPEFDRCFRCQSQEWISRLTQSDRFIPHECPTSERARWLCSCQGNDRWTHAHQNFWYSLGCNPELNAPKCALVVGQQEFQWHIEQGGNHISLNRRRCFAQAMQHNVFTIDLVPTAEWQYYDLLFIFNRKRQVLFDRPKGVPMAMWGHDMWHGDAQNLLDWYRPEILLTSYPGPWKKNFKIPKGTTVMPYFVGASNFFTRSNVDRSKKDVGLLFIGATRGGVYDPRRELLAQLKQLPERAQFKKSVRPRRRPARNYEPLSGNKNRYLNYYSQYIGSARFVIFGRCGRKRTRSAAEMLLPKYYECLGSGAIPIMPEVPDLAALGVKPHEHYIPLSDVEGNNEKLMHYLDNYDTYFHIAQKAVSWHAQNADRLLFDGFEDAIQQATGGRYPRRVL